MSSHDLVPLAAADGRGRASGCVRTAAPLRQALIPCSTHAVMGVGCASQTIVQANPVVTFSTTRVTVKPDGEVSFRATIRPPSAGLPSARPFQSAPTLYT